MPRPLRIERADTCYHVLNRGNAQASVFRDRADYEGFLDRPGRCVARFEIDVLAYVLMDNRYHLLLMYLLWRDGRFRLGRIAEHFGIEYAAVSRAKVQGISEDVTPNGARMSEDLVA